MLEYRVKIAAQFRPDDPDAIKEYLDATKTLAEKFKATHELETVNVRRAAKSDAKK